MSWLAARRKRFPRGFVLVSSYEMARAQKIVCDSCGSTRVEAGSPFCGACGRPTAWATYQDRTDWEVQQWRKARSGRDGEQSTVVALSRKPAPTPVPAKEGRSFLTPADPKPSTTREPRRPSAIASRMRRALEAVRKIFGSSMMVPLETKPGPQTAQPVAAAPNPAEPPRMTLVRTAPSPDPDVADPAPPTPAAGTVTEAAPKAPPKPRKRPNPPTNKDMLKKTLSVLTKVEQRLEQLEQEVACIDDAVRKVVPTTDANDEQTAVGSSG